MFLMKSLLIVLMIIVWIVFVTCVLLMSPKWGLWSALGGIAWSDEYGSKKSLEWKLKKIALVTGILFIVLVLVLPYVN